MSTEKNVVYGLTKVFVALLIVVFVGVCIYLITWPPSWWDWNHWPMNSMGIEDTLVSGTRDVSKMKASLSLDQDCALHAW